MTSNLLNQHHFWSIIFRVFILFILLLVVIIFLHFFDFAFNAAIQKIFFDFLDNIHLEKKLLFLWEFFLVEIFFIPFAFIELIFMKNIFSIAIGGNSSINSNKYSPINMLFIVIWVVIHTLLTRSKVADQT